MKENRLGMSQRRKIGNACYHVFMIALCITMIYPFVWSLIASFKSGEQLYTDSPLNLIPRPVTLENYKRLFEILPFGRFIINSVFLAVAIPLCMIAVASLTAYALTRLNFKGRNVILDKKFGSPLITNDGVTIAKEIELEDHFENMGAKLVAEVASKTNDIAGDGTTTATVLTQAIVREGLKNVTAGANPVGIRRGIELATKAAVEELHRISRTVDSKEAIAQVAAISSGSMEVGELIAEAMEKVGFSPSLHM